MINLCAEQIVLYNNPSINIPTQEQILTQENVSASISTAKNKCLIILCAILLNLRKTNCILVRAYTQYEI